MKKFRSRLRLRRKPRLLLKWFVNPRLGKERVGSTEGIGSNTCAVREREKVAGGTEMFDGDGALKRQPFHDGRHLVPGVIR